MILYRKFGAAAFMLHIGGTNDDERGRARAAWDLPDGG